MIELEAEARRTLDEYLGRVRSALRGCPSVDSAEVERDIMDHVEHELGGAAQPVGVAGLETVLAKLGSPAQWLPQEERSWWWRALSHLRDGPEDFRLAYLTFGTFLLALLLGLFSIAAFFVFLFGSFMLARATAAFSAEKGQLRAQRWLTYPPLLCIYLPLGFFLLCWPAVPVGPWVFEVLEDVFFRRGQARSLLGMSPGVSHGIATCYLTAALAGVWWTVLGLFCRAYPGWLARLFAPLLRRDQPRRAGKWLLVAGVILVAIAAAALAYVLATGPWESIITTWEPSVTPGGN